MTLLRALWAALTRRRRGDGPLGQVFVVTEDESPGRPTPVWPQPRPRPDDPRS